MKVAYVCSECGSKNILRDAWAVWDEDTQKWVLMNVCDAVFCEDCGGETSLKTVKLNKEKSA